MSFVAAVSFRTLRNPGSNKAVSLASLVTGSIMSKVVTPCLSRINDGLSICDKEAISASTCGTCPLRVFFETFMRTGDISFANDPTSGRILSSSSFTD